MRQPVRDEAKSQSVQEVLRAEFLQRIRDLGLEGDPAFVLDLINSYTLLFAKELKSIEESCIVGDADRLHYAAHSLRGEPGGRAMRNHRRDGWSEGLTCCMCNPPCSKDRSYQGDLCSRFYPEEN